MPGFDTRFGRREASAAGLFGLVGGTLGMDWAGSARAGTGDTCSATSVVKRQSCGPLRSSLQAVC